MDTVRFRRNARAALALALLAVVAPAAGADFHGFVSDGPAGLLVFQPCRGISLGKAPYKLSDRSPDKALAAGVAAVRQVMEDPSRPLYIEFAGESSGNAMTAQRFHRAIGHVLACASAPKDIAAGTRLYASGSDTGWRFVAERGGARLQLAPGTTVRFPAASFAQPARDGRTQVFDAWSVQDGGTIRVEVSEEMCLDEQTETAAGARVTLRYATSALTGCAARF